MASSNLFSSPVLLALATSYLLFLQPHPNNANSLVTCHFDKIYQFGDSISDTGNLIRQKPVGAATAFARLPYGETFFKHATGRCSNGRLMIDFIAQASGLPFLNPYLEKDADFRHGVNFAVAGATALTAKALAKKSIIDNLTNSSLKVQLDWMSKHCIIERDCMEKRKTSLFVLKIGGNDYSFAFQEGKSIQDVKKLVPEVVAAIISGVRRAIVSYGAVRVVVPGNFPMGCLPIYLTLFKTNNSNAYDKHRCLIDINSLAVYHNEKLQEAIQELKTEYPEVVIVYGDYYHAFLWLFDHAVQLGFNGETMHKACCGIGGDYNFDPTNMCSSKVPICPNPNQFISWDGIHLTEAAYYRIAKWLIDDMLPKLQCYN
ncbi:hypothetical protein RHSIM_Rhsim07G0189400 [Rhododendron simsii]|uniref:GDSL esterase/lipase At5g03980-like n=1 Tax=Rhododendron simsii TaxID=118357 RepID=A0A834H0P7_RHOSS|nr:hypothetical protein RHSIM_Rhsim07G0189400 [Rhododendron simsii]